MGLFLSFWVEDEDAFPNQRRYSLISYLSLPLRLLLWSWPINETVTNFSNNATCRGGALPIAKFMWYPSRHYPDSMANLYYNNFYNNTIRERDVVSRSNYQQNIKWSKPHLRAFKSFSKRCNRRYARYGKCWNTCRWVPIRVTGTMMTKMTMGSKRNSFTILMSTDSLMMT